MESVEVRIAANELLMRATLAALLHFQPEVFGVIQLTVEEMAGDVLDRRTLPTRPLPVAAARLARNIISELKAG